jgi:hypothetical protein
VHVVNVDCFDAKAAEAAFTRLDKVKARRADVVGIVAHGERGFRRNKNSIAFPGDGFAEDLFGGAGRVNVSGVEQIDAMGVGW